MIESQSCKDWLSFFVFPFHRTFCFCNFESYTFVYGNEPETVRNSAAVFVGFRK